MKKLLIGLTTLFSLAIGSMAFATAADNSGYYLNSNNTSITKTLTVPETNITALNYCDESIYVIVPNSPINYEVFSGNSRTISRNGYYGSTQLVLQDWNRITFFNQYVCRRAIVTVDGRPGAYRVLIDGKYC
jgi:hypothetical protein